MEKFDFEFWNFFNKKKSYLDLRIKKGISFLSMKNMLMIEYLLNLLNLTYMKSNGKKIGGSACVQRLAELRCVSPSSNYLKLFKILVSNWRILKKIGNWKDKINRGQVEVSDR